MDRWLQQPAGVFLGLRTRECPSRNGNGLQAVSNEKMSRFSFEQGRGSSRHGGTQGAKGRFRMDTSEPAAISQVPTEPQLTSNSPVVTKGSRENTLTE